MEATEAVPEGPRPPDVVVGRLEACRPMGYVPLQNGALGVSWGGSIWWALIWRRSRLSLLPDGRKHGPPTDGPEFAGAVVGELDRATVEHLDGETRGELRRAPHRVPLEVLSLLGGIVGAAVSVMIGPGQLVPEFWRPLDDAEEGDWPVVRFMMFPTPLAPSGGVQ